MRAEPKTGEFYRHFKGRLYQIAALATHSETGETLVIYQALYGTFQVYARPLDSFMDYVDAEKYPEHRGEYRFTKVIPKEQKEAVTDTIADKMTDTTIMEEAAVEYEEPVLEGVNPYLMQFLEAEGSEAKIKVLKQAVKHIDEGFLNACAASLDIALDEKGLEKEYQELLSCLETMNRFENKRLR